MHDDDRPILHRRASVAEQVCELSLAQGVHVAAKLRGDALLRDRPDASRLPELGYRGKAVAISEVATSLFRLGAGGSVAACAFYLKTQAGWREVERVELTAADGAPLTPQPSGALLAPRILDLETWEREGARMQSQLSLDAERQHRQREVKQ